jgi:uncharacterized protein (TIGR02677 family)
VHSSTFLLTDAATSRVEAMAYANAANHSRYRAIMRFCYQEHQALRDWLSPQAIHVAVAPYASDDSYSVTDCIGDLAWLVEHGNLDTTPDHGKAKTVSEWNRPRLLYHITPVSVALEAALVLFERPAARGGALNAGLLDRLWMSLYKLDEALHSQEAARPSGTFLREQIDAQWQVILSAFTKLRDETVEYHHALSSSRPTDLARLEAFLLYKDVLLGHLRGFMGALQRYREQLHGLLVRWETTGVSDRLLDLLTEHDALVGVGRVSAEGVPLDQAAVRTLIHAPAVRGLTDWFAMGGGAQMLVDATANAIMLIVRQNERIASRHETGASRRHDLERLARAFAELEMMGADDATADHLAARALGCTTPRHLRGATGQMLLTDRSSVWGQAPQAFPIRRVQRGRQPRQKSAPVRDVSAEQATMLAEEEARVVAERALWDELFRERTVAVHALDLPDPSLRARLMEVIFRALLDPDGEAIASDGRTIRVTAPADHWAYGTMSDAHGVMHMPALTLTIEPGGAATSAPLAAASR